MKKRWMLFIAFVALSLFTGIASAQQIAKPGTVIPLKLNDYSVVTDTPILPDWKPTNIRWLLKDPDGNVVYFVENSLDAVSQGEGAGWGKTKWLISEDTGVLKIPAFAKAGTWSLSAIFYNTLFGFQFQKTAHSLYSVDVEESILDSFNAPIYFTFGGPMGIGSFAFATPDIIMIIAPAILLIVVLINLKPMLERRKKHAST